MNMTEQRLIDIKPLMSNGWHLVQTGESNRFIRSMSLADMPVVDAIEVTNIEEAKQDLLQIVDEFIAEYRGISESYVDHFGGKADAMETARRLINAKLTDLCRKD
jgi:hypothetical protein